MVVSEERYKILSNQITDIEEHLKKDLIKVIPLDPYKKWSTTKDYYNKKYPLNKLKKHKGNFGIGAGYNHDKNEKSIAIIDIDGYKHCLDKNDAIDKDIKKETADYIYELLKDIPGAMEVQTQGGGKHIYFWNRTINPKIHETSESLSFPSDFHITELQDKCLEDTIEIFTKWKSKQCVLPGSVTKKGSYDIIGKINNFSDMGIVDDINEVVKNTLIDKGFIYKKPEPEIAEHDPYESENNTNELKELTNKEINKIVDLLKSYFKKLVGQKHDSYLALGGYLHKNITEKSCKKLVNLLLKATDDNYPQHITTALNNYHRNSTNKKGLPSLLKIIKKKNNLNENGIVFLSHELQLLTNPSYKHNILVKKFTNNKKQYLSIDYNNNEIGTFTFNKGTKKDPDKVYYTNMYPILNMAPKDIYESYNILDKKASPKLCFTFYRKGMPYEQTIEGDDIENVEKQLKKRPGVVLKPREYSGIISEIIKEYVRLNKIHIVEDIPVPGVFINPLTNKLARADDNGSIKIKKPSKKSIEGSLKVLQLLHDNYPGDKTKLSHILRYCLLMPFSYIFKTKYSWFSLLFLYGASQTSKTTLAEIGLCFYTIPNDDISIGGGAFDSPYRIGNALSRQGYGTIINEPGNSIDKTEHIEIIKRAVENEFCREKQDNGIHVKIPAYSNMIFTSNSHIPKADAFIRRSQFIEFTKSERMSDEDVKAFRKRFNHNNWHDTDFNKLRSIGDYVVWYVSENMEFLSKNPYDMLNQIFDSLFDYIGVTPKGWLYENTQLMDVSASDDDIVESFRNMILNDYRKLTSNSSKLLELANTLPELNVEDSHENMIDNIEKMNDERFEQLFTTAVMNDYIPYLKITYGRGKNPEKFVAVNGSVSKYLIKETNTEITCKALADYMDCEYKPLSYKGNKFKGFKLPYEEFRRFLNN